MSIESILKNKVNDTEYWDFADSKLSGVHKISAYPATMVPSMQKELIESILEDDPTIKTIFDPFHGSGVTLVEGMNLGLTPFGFDINPLANLMTLVKLQGVNKEIIRTKNKRITNILLDGNYSYSNHEFSNIDKWFRQDIKNSLSKIREAIISENYKHIRQYYWVCLINIVKKYSNTRSSTFKLHIKEKKDILSLQNNVIRDFIKSINVNYEYLPDYTKGKKIQLYIKDTKEILDVLPKESMDLICTSPPYGDNATTVTYGQYSMLPLYWIYSEDLSQFEEGLLDNYSSIDSASLGGTKNRNQKFNYESFILKDYIESISNSKRKKVERFMMDYLFVCDQLANVLKINKCIILTLGNRRVDNKVLPLTDITKEFFLSKNFVLEAEFSRNIPIKRMPRRVSVVDNKSVESMNSEYVLILRKRG